MKRIAVIGFGFMGIEHSLNILKCKDLELVAIIEKDANAIPEKLKQQTGNLDTGNTDTQALEQIPVYTTLESCLEKEKLDAVDVCVHTNLHYPMVKNALDNNLHVLVEKPFVLDVQKGEELIKLAKTKKRILMVAHVVRFMSPYKILHEWINTEKYGKLKFLSLSRFSGLPDWGQWKEKQRDFGSSGGALFDLVIHDIDFAAFVLGIPEQIESLVLPGKLSHHDFISATWKYPEKDVTVKIEGGNIFHTSYPFRAEFTAVFEKATVSFSSNNVEYIFIDNEKERISIPAGNMGEGYLKEIELFSKSITNGFLPRQYGPESALETVRLCYRHM